MKMKVGNKNLNSQDLEELINHIFMYAETAAKEYDVASPFSQGVAQAYTEVRDSIHNWGIIREAELNHDLETWAEQHLA